ncbi:hypothetical protein DFH08DRAFT_616164, partial [Mycena albidolilacea]
VWDTERLVTDTATDGERTHVPTLMVKDTETGCVQEATSNEGKSALLYKEFFPQKMEVVMVPSDEEYPESAYEWKPISDVLLHRASVRMKMYKAMYAGSFANCVYKFNADLLVPRLGPIYRALDELEYYPEGWNHIDSIVLYKPGKSNYADPAAYHPVCL